MEKLIWYVLPHQGDHSLERETVKQANGLNIGLE